MNSLLGIGASIITVLLNFAVRVILVRTLGEEINGLHALFQSNINVMMLLEMGISSAMIIHLYAPIKNHDTQLICSIMALYRKVYMCLAAVFTLVAIVMALFVIEHMVTTTIPMLWVRIYFLLFALSCSFDYLTYYKRSILFAEQKNRVSMLITAGAELVFRSIQILLLVLYKQYILFLVLLIIEKVVSNIVASCYVNREHPYLRHNHATTGPEIRTAILNTTKPLMVNQVAGTVQQAAKSILISILLGNVAIVGYFGNYQLVIGTVEMLYSQFGGAFTSSFGNLSVDNNPQRMRNAYLRFSFLINWITAILCAGFAVCIQPFIALCFGEQFLLPLPAVMLLTLNMILYLMNIPIISIQNAMGLHRYDAHAMVLQALLAILLGYVGGYFFGLVGIFAGLIIPFFCLTTIRKGIIICRVALRLEANGYLRFLFTEMGKIILVITLSLLAIRYCQASNHLFAILINGSIALVIGLMLPMLLSWRTEQMSYLIQLIKQKLNCKF